MLGDWKMGAVFEKIVPGWLIVDPVIVTLCTLLPDVPILATLTVPVLALMVMFRLTPVKLVKVTFPLLLLTVKSVPLPRAIVPVTKVMAPPPEVKVVRAPPLKLKAELAV